MKLAFEVDVPFEIPTLRFILERMAGLGWRPEGLYLSCYFDKGGLMYAKMLRCATLEDVGRVAQLLARSASWTVEILERWPFDQETGRHAGDLAEMERWAHGKPFFTITRQGDIAELDHEKYWPADPGVPGE